MLITHLVSPLPVNKIMIKSGINVNKKFIPTKRHFDNGKIYAIYGYDEVHCVEIKPDLSGFVEGSDR